VAAAGEHKGPAAEAFANEGWLAAVRHHSLSSFGQHVAAAVAATSIYLGCAFQPACLQPSTTSPPIQNTEKRFAVFYQPQTSPRRIYIYIYI